MTVSHIFYLLSSRKASFRTHKSLVHSIKKDLASIVTPGDIRIQWKLRIVKLVLEGKRLSLGRPVAQTVLQDASKTNPGNLNVNPVLLVIMQAPRVQQAVKNVMPAELRAKTFLVALNALWESFRKPVHPRAISVPAGTLLRLKAVVPVLVVKPDNSKAKMGDRLVPHAQQDNFKGVEEKPVASRQKKAGTRRKVQRVLPRAQLASTRQGQELKIVIAMVTAQRDDFAREPVINPQTVLFAQLDDTDELVRAVANVLLHVMEGFIVLLERERMIKNAVVL